MTAVDDGRVGQREELGLDGRHQDGGIPAGEIGSPDRSIEQHVATKESAPSEEADAPR